MDKTSNLFASNGAHFIIVKMKDYQTKVVLFLLNNDVQAMTGENRYFFLSKPKSRAKPNDTFVASPGELRSLIKFNLKARPIR
jgi:hypothetical protein